MLVASAQIDLTLAIDHLLFDLAFSKTSRKLKPIQVFPAMARQKKEDDPGDIAHFALSDDQTRWERSKKKNNSATHKLSRLPFRLKLIWARKRGNVRKRLLEFQP